MAEERLALTELLEKAGELLVQHYGRQHPSRL
jgi:hypothetical protein